MNDKDFIQKVCKIVFPDRDPESITKEELIEKLLELNDCWAQFQEHVEALRI